MAWIKKHPHLLILILVALLVLAGSGLLVMNAQGFDHNFDALRQPVTKQTKIFQQEPKAIEDAKAEFQAPTLWRGSEQVSSLIVPPRHVINPTTQKPEPLGIGSKNIYTKTKEPIPDKWFLEHNLPVFADGVNRQDPDGDGFSNEEEWFYKTDPNDKTSHPPYYTRLFVTEYRRVPFFVLFQGINGEPAKDKPEDLEFQINFISLRKRSEFLKLGATVPSTRFKIDKFEYKVKTVNEIEVNVSELTLVNLDTNEPLKLVYDQKTDSPDSYAVFRYLWPKPELTFPVKKLQQFVLLPEKDQLYKLLDITEEKAVIQTPSGEKIEIPKLPAGYP